MSASSKTAILCADEEIIAKNSKNVFIHNKGVKEIANTVIQNIKATWDFEQKEIDMDIEMRYLRFFPQYSDCRSADWLFVLNTLNFSLWSPNATEEWRVNKLTGYNALCYVMYKTIIEKKKPLWNPRYYTNLEIQEMKQLFRGDDGTCISFIEERFEILRNIGKILINRYNGTFRTCMKECNYNARCLMFLLTNEFKCYQDKGIYNGKEVCLNTKAKILINDLLFYYPLKINTSSCMMTSMLFTDCRNLRLLFFFEALKCSETFKKMLMTNENPIYYGSVEELELRSCAIVAIKMVCEEVKKMFLSFMKNITDKQFHFMAMVDNFFLSFELDFNDVLKKYNLSEIPNINIKTLQY